MDWPELLRNFTAAHEGGSVVVTRPDPAKLPDVFSIEMPGAEAMLVQGSNLEAWEPAYEAQIAEKTQELDGIRAMLSAFEAVRNAG